MWMFTRLGFYSVTVNPSNTEQMQIRARVKDDLEKLIGFAWRHGVKVESQIREYPGADYPYRVFMSRAQWPMLASRLAETVDYTNFKNTVVDRARHFVYMRVWSIMQQLTPKSADDNQASLWNVQPDVHFTGDEIDTMSPSVESKGDQPDDPFAWWDENTKTWRTD